LDSNNKVRNTMKNLSRFTVAALLLSLGTQIAAAQAKSTTPVSKPAEGVVPPSARLGSSSPAAMLMLNTAGTAGDAGAARVPGSNAIVNPGAVAGVAPDGNLPPANARRSAVPSANVAPGANAVSAAVPSSNAANDAAVARGALPRTAAADTGPASMALPNSSSASQANRPVNTLAPKKQSWSDWFSRWWSH
jgi:hypothetical protein